MGIFVRVFRILFYLAAIISTSGNLFSKPLDSGPQHSKNVLNQIDIEESTDPLNISDVGNCEAREPNTYFPELSNPNRKLSNGEQNDSNASGECRATGRKGSNAGDSQGSNIGTGSGGGDCRCGMGLKWISKEKCLQV